MGTRWVSTRHGAAIAALCTLLSFQLYQQAAADGPVIDGNLITAEWGSNAVAKIATDHGPIYYIRGDATTLYIAADVVGEVTNELPEKLGVTGGDCIQIIADMDSIEALGMEAMAFRPRPGSHTEAVKYAIGLNEDYLPTKARVAAGFGPSPDSATPHRMWEMSIPFDEIKAQQGAPVCMRLATRWASFGDTYPDTKDWLQVRFAAASAGFEPSWWVLGYRRPAAATNDDIYRSITQLGDKQVCYPDGTVELTYVGCGTRTYRPDGTQESPSHPVPCAIQVQWADPPPGTSLYYWADGHNKTLLRVIRTLVGSDKSVSNYQATESGRNLVGQIDLRTQCISYLTKSRTK